MNQAEKDRLARIVETAGNGQPEQQIQPTTEVTTLTGVIIDIVVREVDTNVEHTIVITKVPFGEQIRVPMGAIYAAEFRKKWDERAAAARKPTEEEE